VIERAFRPWNGLRFLAAGAVVGFLVFGITGCENRDGGRSDEVDGGNVSRGEAAIQEYGCGSCHAIPGVPGADGKVGPPLNDIADRQFIAGKLPNDAEHLVRWIQDPQELDPGVAMPDMGISEEDARDIAAYLYTLD
jgi:cytochrome c2